MYRKSKIFISYLKSDVTVRIQEFLNDLTKISYLAVELAEREIETEDEFIRKISKALLECDYFIRILSSDKSQWTNAEIQAAYFEEVRNKNIKVINVMIDYDKKNLFGTIFKNAGVTIDLNSNYASSFQELLDFIKLNESNRLIIFDLDKKVNHQSIIQIHPKVNKKLFEHFSKNPSVLKTIDRRLFEEIIADIFDGFGYTVELTQQTRDGGRDIIAIKNQEVQLKYLIECKRPDPGNKIGIKPVRELFGVKQDEKATKAIFATTSYFSNDAKLFFERNNGNSNLGILMV